MKKYYSIINSFAFTTKDTGERKVCIEWILQSKYPVRWQKKIYFDESDFLENIWWIDKETNKVILSWDYLEAVESMQRVREKRVWNWRKNYIVKWVTVEKDNQTGERSYIIHWLLDTEYSVSALRNFKLSSDQFSTIFDNVDPEDKCYWIKDNILEVIEHYSVVESVPRDEID